MSYGLYRGSIKSTVVNMWPPCDTEWCNPIGRVNKLIVTPGGSA